MIWGKVVSFTGRGAETGRRIAALLGEGKIECYARGVDPSLEGTQLARMVQQAMVDCNLLVFVGACGIAVRAIAPYLQGKAYDPAVLVVDEGAKFVIPLVSGHLGGANALAVRLAEGLGAQAVVTTATDGRGLFAVDTWAREHGCTVLNPGEIRFVSAALLRGESVGLQTDVPGQGAIPRYIKQGGGQDAGVTVASSGARQPFAHTLHLVPRIVCVGLGCRRGASRQAVEQAVGAALKQAGVHIAALQAVASIDVKRDEAGLLDFCKDHNLPAVFYSAGELRLAPGRFTASDFVQQAVGVDNVCERAAVWHTGGGKLLMAKTAHDGVTVALAAQNWGMEF